jgi:hypothetical protein
MLKDGWCYQMGCYWYYKEEMDTMVENKIEPKDVNKYVSTKVREMFLN